jgi:hypothetical protein
VYEEQKACAEKSTFVARNARRQLSALHTARASTSSA